ncbi:MAG: hypothetical protein WBP42_02740 [Candidatus Zixiibacteriota bacterium]
MYRKILLLAAIFVLGSTSFVQSQNYYAYKESGESVSLTVQDTVISAKLADGLQFWNNIYASETALSGDVPPEPLCDGFYRLSVVPGNDPEALVGRLREREDILLANVSFIDANQNPIYITETFVVNFNSSATRFQVDSMNSAHSVRSSTPYSVILTCCC